MSLFPAYSEVPSTTDEPIQSTSTTPDPGAGASWLANQSYAIGAQAANADKSAVKSPDQDGNHPCTCPKYASDDDGRHGERTKKHSRQCASYESKSRKNKEQKHAKKSKKEKKSKEKRERERSPEARPPLEFTGNEEYYVDKKPGKQLQVRKEQHLLHYTVDARTLRDRPKLRRLANRPREKTISGRYYQAACAKEAKVGSIDKSRTLTEDEFTAKAKEFNMRLLGDRADDADMWLDFVDFQERCPMRMNKLQLAERKLDLLNKAMRTIVGNDRLYDKYIQILEDTFPSFEVSQYLDELIDKDPANYSLWNAQIMTSQCSMARCNVPDMLKLYEMCMKNMYKWNRRDEVTLRLFSSCSLFLRQSGSSEKFFALLTLALDLNFGTDKFGRIKVNTNEQTLIEYEELILASGLPMTELWLRIEQLRQNFYFQPCAPNETTDTYRIVSNKDICYYIYPLAEQRNVTHLVLIILRLLKVPLPNSYPIRSAVFNLCDANGRDNYCDFDAIEELATFFLGRTILKPCEVFDDILWSMIREFSNGPSYITTHIGHENYTKYLNELLLTCASCYAADIPAALPMRDALIVLLVRLERIAILFDVYMHKWTDEKDKKYRSKMKGIIRHENNRNCASFYVEYAKIECDLGRVESAENVLLATLGQMSPPTQAAEPYAVAEYWNAAIAYIEMLMAEQQLLKCKTVLMALAFGVVIDNASMDTIEVTEANYLRASKQLQARRDEICAASERWNEATTSAIEYIQPNYAVCAIKAYIYQLLIWRVGMDSILLDISSMLDAFKGAGTQATFIREHLYELAANLMRYSFDGGRADNAIVKERSGSLMKGGACEFPGNMVLLQHLVMNETQPWYHMRSTLFDRKSPIALIFLAIGAQLRYKQYATSLLATNTTAPDSLRHIMAISTGLQDLEKAYKARALNIFRESTEQTETTRKCSLLWRMYLNSLFESLNGEGRGEIILKGLNECPWNKALYMEAFTHAPEEQARLQDLLIEKQMRLYALPEELEMLRDEQPPQ